MTLRPEMIRADTLDLQDHVSPSAQTHSAHPQPSPYGAGPAAAHQEDALQHMNQERGAEQDYMADAWGSGRSSHEGSELLEEDMRLSEEDSRLEDASLQQHSDDAAEADAEELMDDRLSSSPSIGDSEEIDPDFVYALHNFVATVEGQANAAKGDSMVLLDDSNSYWWLVRLVKDSSIGYLPAEHIELPVEREARQNKHRNLELARTHLLDEPGRSKNPLKKAIRRRNGRRVDFSATPYYYEASDYEWSDEETSPDDPTNLESRAQSSAEQQDARNDSQSVEGQAVANGDEGGRGHADAGESVAQIETRQGTDISRSLEDEGHEESAIRVTKAGTIRNTDSFFREESEPRKISLTPNILREESADGSSRSSGSTDRVPASQDSLDSSDRVSVSSSREEKKKKDKKPGMLSGLFKRKDKKIKVDEAAGGGFGRDDGEPGSPMSSTSGASTLGPSSPTSPSSQLAFKRSSGSGKLTKTPPLSSKTSTSSMTATDRSETTPTSTGPQSSASSEQTQHIIQAPVTGAEPPSVQTSHLPQLDTTAPSPMSSQYTPITDAGTDTALNSSISQPSPISPWTNDNSLSAGHAAQTEAISPISPTPELQTRRHGPTGSTDSSARTISPATPVESPAEFSSASAVQPLDHDKAAVAFRRPIIPSSSLADTAQKKAPEWNDAALHAYLGERSNQDARDLLLIINNQAGVVPLPLDHPTMLGFGFHEHQKQLNDMSARLDGLLNGFLARKAARPKASR